MIPFLIGAGLGLVGIFAALLIYLNAIDREAQKNTGLIS